MTAKILDGFVKTASITRLDENSNVPTASFQTPFLTSTFLIMPRALFLEIAYVFPQWPLCLLLLPLFLCSLTDPLRARPLFRTNMIRIQHSIIIFHLRSPSSERRGGKLLTEMHPHLLLALLIPLLFRKECVCRLNAGILGFGSVQFGEPTFVTLTPLRCL